MGREREKTPPHLFLLGVAFFLPSFRLVSLFLSPSFFFTLESERTDRVSSRSPVSQPGGAALPTDTDSTSPASKSNAASTPPPTPMPPLLPPPFALLLLFVVAVGLVASEYLHTLVTASVSGCCVTSASGVTASSLRYLPRHECLVTAKRPSAERRRAASAASVAAAAEAAPTTTSLLTRPMSVSTAADMMSSSARVEARPPVFPSPRKERKKRERQKGSKEKVRPNVKKEMENKEKNDDEKLFLSHSFSLSVSPPRKKTFCGIQRYIRGRNPPF